MFFIEDDGFRVRVECGRGKGRDGAKDVLE
jgi:hypothetical protein